MVATSASAMFVALSQGMGARAKSGRFDAVTVVLELLCPACTLGAMRDRESRFFRFAMAVLAGLLCAAARLSTPRSFPFVLGLFVAVGVELGLARSWELTGRGLTIGAAAAGLGMDLQSGNDSAELVSIHSDREPRRQGQRVSDVARLLAPLG